MKLDIQKLHALSAEMSMTTVMAHIAAGDLEKAREVLPRLRKNMVGAGASEGDADDFVDQLEAILDR